MVLETSTERDFPCAPGRHYRGHLVPLPHLKGSRTKTLPWSALEAVGSFSPPTSLTSARGNRTYRAPSPTSPLAPGSPKKTVTQPNLASAFLELGALVFMEHHSAANKRSRLLNYTPHPPGTVLISTFNLRRSLPTCWVH